MIYSFSDYKNNNTDAFSTLQQLCEKLNDGDTLLLGGGTIDLYPQSTKTHYYCISNNDKGEKIILFRLFEKNNITIDGEGAQLVFHDRALPFVVDSCCRIKISNLSVDYAVPEFCQGRIVSATDDSTVIEFDGKEFFCRVENGNFCFYNPHNNSKTTVDHCLSIEFDSKTKAPVENAFTYFPYTGQERDHGFLGVMYRDVKLKQLSENLIEMQGRLDKRHIVGNYFVCTHGGRDYPAVFVTASADISITSIMLYHALSMGVICQTSENILLDGVYAQVKDGSSRMLSVKADATHFVNCRGYITIKNSKFVNMMDDACNIHGIYLKEVEKIDSHTIKAYFGHYQQYGINIFKSGDTVRIIDPQTITQIATYTVKQSCLCGEQALVIDTLESVSELQSGYVIENLSTAPVVTISGCETGNNRPRGFLVASYGKTIIENCLFYNMYMGINIGGEVQDWYESGQTDEVIIRNNSFTNSAYCGGYPVNVFPCLPSPERVDSFHGRIVLENNCFTMGEKRFLNAFCVEKLVFRGNKFKLDPTMPKHGCPSADGIVIEKCQSFEISAVEEL